jgi:hypothetical protein
MRWSKTFLILLILATLTGDGKADAELNQARPNEHQEPAAKHQDAATNQESQVPLSVLRASQAALSEAVGATKQEAEADNKQADAYKETLCSPSVLIQMGLLVVGAIYSVFAALQWKAIRAQSEISKQQLEETERAFIFADVITVVWMPDRNRPDVYNWRFRPRWQNTGGTPTKGLIMHVECMVRDDPLQLGYDFIFADTDTGKGLIGPHSSMLGGWGSQPPITPEDLQGVLDGKKFIYLWGCAKYFDVFPDTRQHTSHFCWIVTVVGNPFRFVPTAIGQPPVPGTMAFGNVQHPEGNYAD